MLRISGLTRPDIAIAVMAVAQHAHNPAATLEGGSEGYCLSEDNQGSGGCVPAGRGLETVVVR